MAPRLEDLPAELLVNIASNLTTVDYGSVRLTSSTIEQKLFDNFGREFFKRKQFMLTQSSLQTLVDISKHEALKHYLTRVIIGTNYIPRFESMLHSATPCARTAIQLASHDTKKWLQELRLDQRYLIDQGLDRVLLTEALNSLPACHEIELRDSYFPSRYRGEEKWTSYGSTEILKRFHTEAWLWWHDDENPARRHHAYSTVIHAMASSAKSKQYTAFMVTTRQHHNDLGPDAFYQPKFANFATAFQHTTTLMLPIHMRETYDQDLSYFVSFLRHFPNLEYLRLNGTRNCDTTEWMIATKHGLNSCSLLRLSLGKMRLQSEDLNDLLSSLQTLEHLEFFLLELESSWAATLARSQLSQLKTLEANMIGVGPRFGHERVGFKSSVDAVANGSSDLTTSIKVQGPGWFDEFTGRLVVQTPSFLGIAEDESAESDSDDDLDDDDDDDDEIDEDDMDMDDEE
ncbi:Low affinity vacuolar monovalent cation/H(+) antiporter [Venturia nashicola]|uniref:Low affinity vacuolar monovalent cation/H(+) antiporter n=1 Tax=Venturia nashicola TaxID=86259 RepID=A0A4Z1PCY1_9PEZI|nr:Low affinity vacuolar monovalent cation/H(+) antiporter [Venturia nashicola]